MAFRGMGKIGIRSTELTDASGNAAPLILWAPRANSFTLALASEKQEKRAWLTNECGPSEIVDTVITGKTWTLRVGIQSFDATDVSFMMDEKIRTSATAIFPEVASIAVPAGGVIPLTGVASPANAAAVVIDEKYTGKRTLALGDGFTITGGSMTITDAALVGKSVAYMYDRSYTAAETIGLGVAPSDWGVLCFSGVACGPRFPRPMQVYCPAMDRSGNFDLSVGDDTTLDLEFTPKVKEPFRSAVVVKV